MLDLTVVIVNYRTAELAIEALRSLEPELARCGSARVCVVDNASGDGSAERLDAAIRSHRWSSWVTLLALAENGGFGAGNNAALRPALARPAAGPAAFLLLNPDTVVRPGAVGCLLDFLDEHPRAGIVGPRLEDPDGTPQRSSFRFPSLRGELEQGLRLGLLSRLLARHVVAPPVRDDAHATDWLSGACLLVRREVFERIGLFDERYFLYFEETDLCRRARENAFECWQVPSARVVHLVGQSTARPGAPPRRSQAWLASRRHYFRTHHGRLALLAADLIWSAAYASWRVRRVLQRKPDPDPPAYLADFVRYNLLGRRS